MNFQAFFSSPDKEQRLPTLSKYLQFPQVTQQVRQKGKSSHRGNKLAVSKALQNSVGHHHLKDVFRKPLHELAGGDAKGAAFVAHLLRHSTNTTRNHKCPERNKCSSTAQSKALLFLGNHCRSPILTSGASTR